MIIAGLSYLIDYFGKLIFSNFDVTFSLIGGWGELIFMFWLLFKGGKIPSKDAYKEVGDEKDVV